MSAGLKARIGRLEREQRIRPMPRIVLSLRAADEADIIGYEGNGVVVLRGDESAEACCHRAFVITGAVILATKYSPEGHRRAEEREWEALPTLPASKPPIESDAPEIDPWELAGIGREATRDELMRMGAIRLPPERLI